MRSAVVLAAALGAIGGIVVGFVTAWILASWIFAGARNDDVTVNAVDRGRAYYTDLES